MPLRNRVTPFGEIVAVPGRGTVMGNRGILHDDRRRIVRDSQVRRWITCRLDFRGRHRQVMTAGSYTELFFLDEAAAMAAGHRPCAECRHDDFLRFRTAWQSAFPSRGVRVDDIDRQLHAERRAGPWQKRTFQSDLADLPAGAYISLEGRAWLVESSELLEWSPDRYLERRPRAATGEVTVLTPPALVAVLRNGFAPLRHPTTAQPR